MHPKKTIFNIAEAKAHFFDAARARATRGNHGDRQSWDAMRAACTARASTSQPGALKGRIKRAKAFFEPLSEEELRLWEGE
jgi:hypothetical protein